MRFLGYLFLLLAIVAVGLDVLVMQQDGGAFELRGLLIQLTDLGLDGYVAPYNTGYVATALAQPGALVLGGVGVAFLILSALLFGRD